MKRIWFVSVMLGMVAGLMWGCFRAPDAGWIKVVSDPAGAVVFINDSLADEVTDCVLGDIPEGKYVIRLELKGYSVYQEQIEVIGGDTAEVVVLLSQAYGHLYISSTPEGAAIWLDNVNTGATTPYLFVNIAVGEYTLRLVSEGYFDWKAVINVREGDTIRLSAVFSIEEGILKWRYKTGGATSSPAIGSDDRIYIASEDGYLYAFESNGNLTWKCYMESGSECAPALGPDATIYLTSKTGYLCAVSPNGSLVWSVPLAYRIPAIGNDGTIYIGSSNGHLYAFNSDGEIIWKYETDGLIYSSPAIDTAGNIYVGASQGYLYSFKPDGTLRWKCQETGTISSPLAIGSDGTIYVGAYYERFCAINPDGTLKWVYQIGYAVYPEPTIGFDERIYIFWDVIAPDGSLIRRLYPGPYDLFTSITVASDGTLYFGAGKNNIWTGEVKGYVYALDSEGRIKWRYDVGEAILSNLVLANDGTLYFGTSDGYLYALQTDSYGLADSPWPAPRHDNANTGRADGP